MLDDSRFHRFKHEGLRSFMMLALLSTACSGGDRAPGHALPFETIFEKTEVIRLEEDAGDPIIDLPWLAFSGDGRIAVADQRANRLRVFERTGAAIGCVGHMGDGPGEFQAPKGVAFDGSGHVVVGDLEGRITRFDRDLSVDTTFLTGGTTFNLFALPDGRLLVHMFRRAEPMLDILSQDGARLGSFHAMDALINEVPYWISAHFARIAVGDTVVLAAENLIYPIHVYDLHGVSIATFGSEPPSWEQAERVRRGEFRNMRQDRWEDWLKTFTQISGMAVLADGTLVVVHGRYAPSAMDRYGVEDYALDLYDGHGNKLVEDVPVPGRLVGADGNTLFFIVSGPPGSWVINGYRRAHRPTTSTAQASRDMASAG